MSTSKLIGGILLIVGTSIGGGMLALPVATAEAGLVYAIIFLTLSWLVMTAGALLILEANLRLPPGSNIISMAKQTLGLPGQIVAWFTYLFLLYTLLAAYIAGGGDVFHAILQKFNLNIPQWFTPVALTLLFSIIIFKGIQAVDYVNRGLMFGKIGVYILLVVLIAPHVNVETWENGNLLAILGTLMLLITSFGFATLVPTLREYFDDDIPKLKKAIIIGSFIPLLCYILWEAIVMGVIHRDGVDGLMALASSEHSISGLTESLNTELQSNIITRFFTFFTSICMLTAFLGVSISLFDFLHDGLNLKRKGTQGLFVLALTFIPPLLLVLVYPGMFIAALNYAGFFCVVLLLILPALMVYRGRKIFPVSDEHKQILPGGNISLLIILIISVVLIFLRFYL